MSSNIVTSFLHEGLGNLMFQIAAAIGHSKKYNKTTKFYKQFYSPSRHGSIEQYQHNILKKIIFDDLEKESAVFYKYNEPDFSYSPIPDSIDSIVLFGYFQSYRYFDHCKPDIINFFNFSLPNYNYKDILEKENTCSIHVRRGDYTQLSNYHTVLDISYYQNAIDLLGKDYIYIIISDDINWCYSVFNSLNFNSKIKFIFLENSKPCEDFYIAKNCKNNIIANSTFSWWSAWLNTNTSKKVVIPKKWFGEAYRYHDTSGFYCDDWISI